MIKVLKEDITKLNVDIIVNAANKSLMGGGGVDGAIHRAAGPKLNIECAKLNGCETGEAKMTDAYNLPCKKIIHTVGPVYRDGFHNEDKLLKNCYYNSLVLAKKYMLDNNLKEVTIAFPCISTGIYGYPNKEASDIAFNTVKEFDKDSINVIFVCFLDKDYNLYNNLVK